MRRSLIIILMIVLCGCARPTIKYGEYIQETAAPDHLHIRFVLFRPKDSFDAKIMGGGRSVRIKIDDQKAGYIRGGFKTFDLLPGKHTISVDLWDQPGQCALEVAATAGSEYYFQIGPMGTFVGAVVGQAIVGAAIHGVGPGPAVAGAAVLSAVSRSQPCGGDFYIEAIEKDAAKSKFADLHKN